MQITVNQKPFLLQGQNLCDVCAQMHLPFAGIAIAVNGAIVPLASWDSYFLRQDDQVTIIRATRGG